MSGLAQLSDIINIRQNHRFEGHLNLRPLLVRLTYLQGQFDIELIVLHVAFEIYYLCWIWCRLILLLELRWFRKFKCCPWQVFHRLFRLDGARLLGLAPIRGPDSFEQFGVKRL